MSETHENANAVPRRSERLRGVVACTYDRNLSGNVGGILVGAVNGGTKAQQKKPGDAAATAAAAMPIPDFTFNRVRFYVSGVTQYLFARLGLWCPAVHFALN